MQAKHYYYEHILSILKKVHDEEKENIEKSANIMAEAIEKGNSIYVFGASHAGILTQEMFYRAGGLIPLDKSSSTVSIKTEFTI